MTSFREDRRGALSFHILVFGLSLILAGLLYILLQPMADTLLNLASQETSTKAADDGQNYVRIAFANMHFLVIGVGILQLIAAAVYESEVTLGP